MRANYLILSALLVAFIFAVSSPISVKCVNWQRVTQFTGSGSQATSEFHIRGSEWRINWSYIPNSLAPSLTAFSLFVYPHGETKSYVDDVIQYGSSATSGTLYIHEGPKLYYLEILAANTPSYTIIIDYDADSEASTGLLIAIIVAVIMVPTVITIAIVYVARKKYRKQKNAASTTLPPPPPPPP